MSTAVDLVRELADVGVALELRGRGLAAVGTTSHLTGALRARLRDHGRELARSMRALRELDRLPDPTPTAAQWEAYWTRFPEMRPAAPLAPQEPARAPLRHRHVSHVDRPPRYCPAPCVGADRVCVACGERRGPDGPLGYAWDVHRLGAELVVTCSAACRADRRFDERKPRHPSSTAKES